MGRALIRQYAGVDRRRRAIEGNGFSPLELSAVGCWLRNATLSGAISSVADLANPSSPATQATSARQPTGNADGSMSFGGDDCLIVPFHANNQSTTAIGFCFWLNNTSLAAQRNPFSQTGAAGASSSRGRLDILTTGAGTRTGGAAGGQGDNAAGSFTAGAPHFISVEFDGAAALGSRHSLFIDNVLIASSGDTLPAALTSATGTWTIGAIDTSGTTGVLGSMGRNFYVLNSKMAGATQGLLTSTARAALMNFEPLA